jgi:hypothetical protein
MPVKNTLVIEEMSRVAISLDIQNSRSMLFTVQIVSFGLAIPKIRLMKFFQKI